MLRTLKALYEKHKSRFLTLAFIFGFIIDTITLNRVDELLDNMILLTYVVLAVVSLVSLYASTAGKFPEKINEKIRRFSPLVTQYAYGGLFSGMLIFYGRSGFWLTSWPFLLIILIAIYLNETITDRVQRLLYNIGMLFIGLFAYVVLVVPVVIGQMGTWIFVGSGIFALCLMLLFIRILQGVVPRFISLHKRAMIFVIGIIFVTFNFLYFANIIPPIPLSLKSVGIYHSVIRFPETGVYELKYEEGTWWQFYKQSDDIFHPVAGGNVFCFAKVFAPTKIETSIYHRWEYYDEKEKRWREHFRMAYPIQGGADGGYRGYTSITNYSTGTWRCSVETGRGQVLGRETFKIRDGEVRPLQSRQE